MKHLIYCRKSSEDEDRQTLSIEAQIKEAFELVKKHNITVAGKPIKESKTAKDPGRPEFNKMTELIEKGFADSIICWKLDRLARNSVDGGQIIYLMDKGLLKEIITPHRIYSNKGDDKFIMQIEFGMAKKYVDDLSDNVIRGLNNKIDRQEFPGMVPVGYLNIDPDYKRIVAKQYTLEKQAILEKLNRPLKRVEKDPLIAPVIENMFTEYAKGTYTLTSISERLFNAGITGRNKKPLVKASIKRILTNPFYYGNFIYRNQICKGNHEPIISKKLFDKVQEIIGTKTKIISSAQDFKFRGIIKCKVCGCAIIGETKIKPSGKSYTYYRCSKRRGNCGQSGIREENLEKELNNFIKRISLNKRQWELALKLARLEFNDYFESEIKIRKELQKELNIIDKRKSELLNLKIDKVIDKNEFILKNKEFNSIKADIEEKLADNSQNASTLLEKAEYYFEKAYSAEEVFSTGDIDERKILLLEIGWNFELKDKKLDFEYKKPFDYISEHKPENILMQTVGTLKNTCNKTKNRSLQPDFAFVRGRRDSNSRPLA